MINVTFTDSACGGLKEALGLDDGGSSLGDVFGVGLNWSIGDISDDAPESDARFRVMHELYGVYPESPDTGDNAEMVREWQMQVQNDFISLLRRAGTGEALRLWYSDAPDELSGAYWLLAKLRELKIDAPVTSVRLPRYKISADDTVLEQSGWGDVSLSEWRRCLSLERPLPRGVCHAMADRWRELREENAPLRAALNGRLTSMPADCYDSFIRRVAEAQPDIFEEARLIGLVLGKYQIGVGDAWLALRIEKMVQNGELIPLTAPPADLPAYWRTLKKAKAKVL